jgi:hypothetical protein
MSTKREYDEDGMLILFVGGYIALLAIMSLVLFA